MQSEERRGAANEIQISLETAFDKIKYDKPRDIIDADVSLNILDLNNKDEITFFHQLLQEYFAARRLAARPQTGTRPSGVAPRSGRSALRRRPSKANPLA
jgi:predicted NACHT family NTPase